MNEFTNVGVEKFLVPSLALLQLHLQLDVFSTGHKDQVLVVGLFQPIQGLHHNCDLKDDAR